MLELIWILKHLFANTSRCLYLKKYEDDILELIKRTKKVVFSDSAHGSSGSPNIYGILYSEFEEIVSV